MAESIHQPFFSGLVESVRRFRRRLSGWIAPTEPAPAVLPASLLEQEQSPHAPAPVFQDAPAKKGWLRRTIGLAIALVVGVVRGTWKTICFMWNGPGHKKKVAPQGEPGAAASHPIPDPVYDLPPQPMYHRAAAPVFEAPSRSAYQPKPARKKRSWFGIGSGWRSMTRRGRARTA